MKKILLVSIILLCSFSVAQEAAKTASKSSATKSAAKKEPMKAKNAFAPDEVQWGPAPPFIQPGASLAVLEGNPMGATGDYTVRLKMPDGYKIAPHWHPKRENVTIISGSFKVGMGDKFDESKMMTFPAGSFAFLDPSMHHYAMSNGETVVQIHGAAPVKFNYIDPNDDPSKKKK
ncbi:MAG TPA: cupin domain-containing protein [Terriglobia bacterium]|nr:cupin domain-containing protein [Terriglobia bacterium]